MGLLGQNENVVERGFVKHWLNTVYITAPKNLLSYYWFLERYLLTFGTFAGKLLA